MDEVFRALAAPTRRELLDELFRRDGQTLSELERRVPMSRVALGPGAHRVDLAARPDDHAGTSALYWEPGFQSD